MALVSLLPAVVTSVGENGLSLYCCVGVGYLIRGGGFKGMHTCIRISLCCKVYAHMHARICIEAYTCTPTSVAHMCEYIRADTHRYTQCIHVYRRTVTHIHMYISICVFPYIHMCILATGMSSRRGRLCIRRDGEIRVQVKHFFGDILECETGGNDERMRG